MYTIMQLVLLHVEKEKVLPMILTESKATATGKWGNRHWDYFASMFNLRNKVMEIDEFIWECNRCCSMHTPEKKTENLLKNISRKNVKRHVVFVEDAIKNYKYSYKDPYIPVELFISIANKNESWTKISTTSQLKKICTEHERDIRGIKFSEKNMITTRADFDSCKQSDYMYSIFNKKTRSYYAGGLERGTPRWKSPQAHYPKFDKIHDALTIVEKFSDSENIVIKEVCKYKKVGSLVPHPRRLIELTQILNEQQMDTAELLCGEYLCAIKGTKNNVSKAFSIQSKDSPNQQKEKQRLLSLHRWINGAISTKEFVQQVHF